MKMFFRPFRYSFIGAACAGAALLNSVDARSQNLFVDSGSTIYEYTSDGTQSTFATGLTSAGGMAFDTAGNLYVADTGSGNVYEYSAGAVRTTIASGLSSPMGLAVDSSGNVYVSQAQGSNSGDPFAGHGVIIEIASGEAQNTFATGLYPIGTGLAYSGGLLYITDAENGSVDAVGSGSAGGDPVTQPDMDDPYGVEFDNAGHLFVSTATGIYEFNHGRMPSNVFGSGMAGPYGLALDNGGDLFVGDYDGNIDEFTPGGTESTFAFGVSPAAMAFDPVPEPSLFGLLVLGASSFLIWHRRRKID